MILRLQPVLSARESRPIRTGLIIILTTTQSVSFHPLTNRKHHCRLCGRIICSLPVKKPQRPVPCSLLFVADPKSGRIEEVKESVDYGVRPRGRVDSLNGGKGKAGEVEEKFIKGVRICRECKPIMLYVTSCPSLG